MLDLQAANQASSGMASFSGSQVDSVLFQRVIGSLGASLEPIDIDGPPEEPHADLGTGDVCDSVGFEKDRQEGRASGSTTVC